MSALVCARLSCVPTGCIHFFSHEPHQLRPFRVCKSGAAGPDSAALAAHKLVWKDCSSNGGKIYVKIGKEGTNPGPAREGKAAGRAWSRSVLWCRIRLRQIRLRRSGCDGGGSGCDGSGMLSGCSVQNSLCCKCAMRRLDCNGSNCKRTAKDRNGTGLTEMRGRSAASERPRISADRAPLSQRSTESKRRGVGARRADSAGWTLRDAAPSCGTFGSPRLTSVGPGERDPGEDDLRVRPPPPPHHRLHHRSHLHPAAAPLPCRRDGRCASCALEIAHASAQSAHVPPQRCAPLARARTSMHRTATDWIEVPALLCLRTHFNCVIVCTLVVSSRAVCTL